MLDDVAVAGTTGLPLDQTGIEQNLYMLRHCRLRQRQRLGHVGATALALLLRGEDSQDVEADRMAKRPHDIGNVVVAHGFNAIIGDLR